MGAVVCPHCNATLPASEVAAGWCESCGKKLPSYAVGYTADPSFTRGPSSTYGDSGTAPPRSYYGYALNRPLASRAARLGAAILDGLLGLIAYGPGYAVVMVGEQQHKDEILFLGLGLLLIGIVILVSVQITLLCRSGQTLGKKLAGVRIVRYDDSSNPGFVGAVLLRSFVPGLISSIPCVGPVFSIVDILYIFSEERRCVHDHIAGTKVVEA